ncbi:TonB-dependent siderophore receptor [Xylophilus rhododendri]|uniref:TonB-dependent siderophore receptor n=1 Tax=Xylophilus rhododendri TaxID=2697032 RepID=A0A857JF02_9BURK|nr:TonB-dependent siderophore receptor [Xylophilus rhododendri]
MTPLGAMMLAASVTGWAMPATAQTLPAVTVTEQADVQGKDALLTKKTNIGKGTQDIRDIPQSITVITEKLIDDIKLDTLKDALHYTAGITFAATENGTDQDIRLRGFPIATTGDLMIDGMRDPSQYDRDTFNTERIEVMKGSASMLFGRGSTGGVVNQVAKKPMLLDQSDVTVSAGTMGYLRTTVDVNKRLTETTALRLNAMYNKADNDGASIDKNGIAPSYSWGLGTPDEFTLGAFYLNNNNVPPSGIGYVGGKLAPVKAGAFYGTDSDYADGNATYVHGNWKHLFGDGSELRTQFRSGVFERQTWITQARIGTTNGVATTAANFGDNTILTRVGLAPRKDRFKSTYVQSDYSKSLELGGMRHELLAGIDAAHEQALRFGGYGTVGTNYAKGNTTVGNPDDGTRLNVSPTYRGTEGYKSDALGLYLQDLVQVAPMWKVLGGVRYDKFDGNYEQYTYANANSTVRTATASNSFDFSPWSYRAGLLFQPSTTQSYHLSYGTSFTTAADTYRFTNAQNANTPPEKSRNIELGAKLDWLDGNLSTRGAIFRSEKFNERTTDADFGNIAYTLSGKRHSTGVELDVVGRITPQWEVYGSFTWIPDAKIDAAGSAATAQATVGQRVGLTPKRSGALWVSYQANAKFRVALGGHGSSENFALAGTSGAISPNARAPGFMVFDAMAEYKFTPDLYAQLNVSNLGDKAYGDALYPGFAVLGAKRQVLATIGMRF